MFSSLKTRTVSSLILWALLLGALSIGRPELYIVLLGAICGLACWEYSSLYSAAKLNLGRGVPLAVHLIYVVGLHWQLWRAWRGESSFLDFDSLALVGAFLAFYIHGLLKKVTVEKNHQLVSANFFGFIYISFLFCFIGKLLFLFPASETSMVPGIWYVFWFVLVTKFGDMGALFAGSMLGKNPAFSHISPSKTWEGVIGALFLSSAAGVVDYFLFAEKLTLFRGVGEVVFLSLLISLAGIFGDLAESLLKRNLKAKDSGENIPGIGGILDLIDSLLFAAPVMYFYVKYVMIAG